MVFFHKVFMYIYFICNSTLHQMSFNIFKSQQVHGEEGQGGCILNFNQKFASP